MQIHEIVLCGVGLALLAKSRQPQVDVQAAPDMNDPTNWGADMWARIYGADLAATGGQHAAPSSFSAYGVNGVMGFNK